MSGGRWSFSTVDSFYVPDGVEVYQFKINPNRESSRVPSRAFTWNSSSEGYSGTRAPRAPFPWEFSGVVRSPEQYAAMLLWLNKKTWIAVTDDLGRVVIWRPTSYEPKQQGQTRNRHAPWRHEYTMKGLIKP